MQGFNFTETVGTNDTLTAKDQSLKPGSPILSTIEKLTDFGNAHNGSGSSMADLPDLIENIKTTILTDMKTKFSDFDNAVSDYFNADDHKVNGEFISSLVDELTGNLPNVAKWAVMDWPVANTGILAEAVSSATDTLTEFKGSADFLDDMEMTFGEDITADAATDAINSLLDGSAGINFQIKDLGSLGADAAFAAATNTIYLSSTFLSGNKGNTETVANVILEEWGHYLDTALNDTDSEGDEGEIFVSLVKDFNFDIHALKAEDDTARWNIDGQTVMVEKVSGSLVIPIPGSLLEIQELAKCLDLREMVQTQH